VPHERDTKIGPSPPLNGPYRARMLTGEPLQGEHPTRMSGCPRHWHVAPMRTATPRHGPATTMLSLRRWTPTPIAHEIGTRTTPRDDARQCRRGLVRLIVSCRAGIAATKSSLVRPSMHAATAPIRPSPSGRGGLSVPDVAAAGSTWW